jgi:hypothetical protein
VQFDLDPQELKTPEDEKDEPRHRSSSRRDRDHESRKDKRDDRDDRGRRRDRNRGRDRDRRRDGSADSAASDETIELPPRFDNYGRRKEDDPLAEKLESVLNKLFA